MLLWLLPLRLRLTALPAREVLPPPPPPLLGALSLSSLLVVFKAAA